MVVYVYVVVWLRWVGYCVCVCTYVCVCGVRVCVVYVCVCVLVFLHNYCSDDIDINMKWYILYIVYSTHL